MPRQTLPQKIIMRNISRRIYIFVISVALLFSPAPLMHAYAGGENADAEPVLVDISDVTEETAYTDEVLVLAKKDTKRKEMAEVARSAGASLEDMSVLEDGTKLAKVSFDDPEDMQEVADSIYSDDSVLFVQPNYIYMPFEEESGQEPDEDMPENDVSELELMAETGDPDTGSQWYLNPVSQNPGAADVKSAWNEMSDNGSSVIVAVIDTGVQLDHPDLENVILKDRCVTFNNGRRGTFTQWDGSDDDHGHGTHICGIIGAEAGNNIGIAGVANNRAKIIAVDAALPDTYAISSQDTILAVNYAVSQGARIINLSFGAEYRDYLVENAVNSAFLNGTLVVCAAGNESTALHTCPGDASGAVSVKAHTRTGRTSSFSNYNSDKDVSAPGASIYSTYTGSSYSSLSGTSMAAPVVSGIAALLLSENEELTARELKNLIYTSSDAGTYTSGETGLAFGRINAKNALQNLKRSETAPESIVLNHDELVMYPGEETDLEYAVYPGTASRLSDEAEFLSSDSNVLEVDSFGHVKAVSPGKAKITVSCGGLTKDIPVKINEIPYEHIGELPYAMEGALSVSDPVIRAEDDSVCFDSFMDGYVMTLTKGDRITATLTSNEMTPFLRILDQEGNVIRSKGYTGTAANKTLPLSIEPGSDGTYRLEVLCLPDKKVYEERTYTLEVTHDHSLKEVEEKEASCKEDGNHAYYICTYCGAIFSDRDGTERLSEIPVKPAYGHSYGNTEYTWSMDLRHVTARRVCSLDPSHVETETVETVEAEREDASCIEEGSATYVTKEFNNKAFEVQSKEVSTGYGDHSWNEPVYAWSTDNREVAAERVCRLDPSHKITETVKTNAEAAEDASCIKKGKVIITASFKDPAFMTQTKTLDTAYADHDWKDPVYTWSSDLSGVTAERVCRTDSSHRERETAEVTKTVTRASTCTAKGIMTYTSKEFRNSAFSIQIKDVSLDLSSDHNWMEPVYAWSQDNKTVTATRLCANDISHRETETVNTTSKVTREATESENGETTYTAVFSNAAFRTQTKRALDIPPAKNSEGSSAEDTTSGPSEAQSEEPANDAPESEGEEHTEPLEDKDTETPAVKVVVKDLPSVKIKSIVRGEGSFTLKWKKLSAGKRKKITGLQIQYCRKKDFSSGVKNVYASKASSSKKIRNLASKKTYYVRIRSYKKTGDVMHTSAWSAAKKVKTRI